ncbi:MAG: cysteine-rich CWC family protein [Thermoleophilia bacterium]
MSSRPSTCPRCSSTFVCGIDTGACWCAEVDVNEITRASLAEFYDGCLCRECLRSLEDERPQVPTVRAFLTSQLKRKSRRRA